MRRGSAINLRLPCYARAPEADATVNVYLLGRNDATTVSATSPGSGTTTNTPGSAACPNLEGLLSPSRGAPHPALDPIAAPL
jgi:hypothetical protein